MTKYINTPALERKIRSAPKLSREKALTAFNAMDDAKDIDLCVLLAGMKREGVSDVQISEVTATITKRWGIYSKVRLRQLLAEVNEALHPNSDDSQMHIETKKVSTTRLDFRAQCEHTRAILTWRNDKSPTIFRYGKELAEIVVVSQIEQVSIDPIGYQRFEHLVNAVVPFCTGDKGAEVGVSAPDNVLKFLYNDRAFPLPYLESIIRTPVFNRRGILIKTPGYHPDGHVYLAQPKTLFIKDVSPIPSPSEMREARRLLVEEFLGDFPFDRMSREELVRRALGGDRSTPPPASLLNTLSLILEQFCRPIIDGPLPLTLIGKPSPRTGASLLAFGIQTLVTGSINSQVLAADENEREKRAVATLRANKLMTLFDNVAGEVAGAVLAKLLTDRVFEGRELGRSTMLTLPVTGSHIMTGNNPAFSRELAQRVSRVRIDACQEDPSSRTDFRHTNLIGWVSANRADLIWAALTLIQHWIAVGRPGPVKPTSDDPKLTAITWGGYESYVEVIGGIIGAAADNWTTWQTNRLTAVDESTENDVIKELLTAWLAVGKDDPERLTGMSVKGKDGLIFIAGKEGIYVPVKKVERDDPFSYDPAAFGAWLAKHKDAVFELSPDGADALQVELLKDPKRTKSGFTWSLVKAEERAAQEAAQSSAEITKIPVAPVVASNVTPIRLFSRRPRKPEQHGPLTLAG